MGPKIDSLVDCFDEKEINIAVLTETWFQHSCGRLDDDLCNLSEREGINIIHRTRSECARNGRRYGGVAIAFGKYRCSLTEFKLNNPSDFEVVAAAGKINGHKGKAFIIGVYIPPNCMTSHANDCLTYISDLAAEAKRQYEDPKIIIAGDFNQWGTGDVLDDHHDLSLLQHGPTRGDRTIDLTLLNFGRQVTASETLEPLEDEFGHPSDHRIVFFSAESTVNSEKTIEYSYRHYTQKGATDFKAWLADINWLPVFLARSSSAKVDAFEAILSEGMDLFFPWKKTVRRESEPPWINNQIRSLVEKRRKIYDREGRSDAWKALKKKTKKVVKRRAREYRSTQKEKLLAKDAARDFYKNVKSYSCKEKPQTFDVRQLFDKLSDPRSWKNSPTILVRYLLISLVCRVLTYRLLSARHSRHLLGKRLLKDWLLLENLRAWLVRISFQQLSMTTPLSFLSPLLTFITVFPLPVNGPACGKLSMLQRSQKNLTLSR